MRPSLNPNDIGQIYSKNGYISLSPKISSTTFARPINATFNSPKNETQKPIMFSPPGSGQIMKYPSRPEKVESSNDRSQQASLNQTSSAPRLNVKVRPVQEDRRNGDEKLGASLELNGGLLKYNNVARVSESLNLRDMNRREKTKRLEIATDYNGKPTIPVISQSTKNRDYSDKTPSESMKKNIYGQNSSTSSSSVYDEKNTSTRSKGLILNRHTLAQEKTSVPVKRGTSDKSGAESGSRRNPEYEDEDSITRSAEFSKKAFSRTHLDLKLSMQQEASNKNDLSDVKNNRDNSMTKNNGAAPDEKNTTQKVSLQTFVTKVNKGEIFGKKPTEKEDSSRRPYLMLDEKNKTPKSSNLVFKGTNVQPKTTTSNDSKVFVFNNNKLVEQKQEKKSTRGSTPLNKTQNKESDSDDLTPTMTPTTKKPFIYYMTNLEKFHRNIENEYFAQIYREHFMQSFQAMMFCRFLRPVDPKVLASKKVYLNKRETHKDKKTIVFDLDETLIHCNESTDIPYDVKLPIKFPHGETIEAGINVRPYAVECLKELNQHFEIIVFTASHACYANVVLDYLDPGRQLIHHRLFRDSCVVTDEGIYIKDLRVLANRNLQELVLVDNAAYSFGYQVDNGIPIIPYYDNKSDQELRHLVPYLKFLNGVKDLREINKQTFKFYAYTMYDSADKVLDKVILQPKTN